MEVLEELELRAKIAGQPLGPVLKKLNILDHSDGKPYLSGEDYKLLDEIRDIRNHWAHQAYTEFVYCNGTDYEVKFGKEFRRLQNDHNRLSKLSANIERVRLEVLRKYGRI